MAFMKSSYCHSSPTRRTSMTAPTSPDAFSRTRSPRAKRGIVSSRKTDLADSPNAVCRDSEVNGAVYLSCHGDDIGIRVEALHLRYVLARCDVADPYHLAATMILAARLPLNEVSKSEGL